MDTPCSRSNIESLAFSTDTLWLTVTVIEASGMSRAATSPCKIALNKLQQPYSCNSNGGYKATGSAHMSTNITHTHTHTPELDIVDTWLCNMWVKRNRICNPARNKNATISFNHSPQYLSASISNTFLEKTFSPSGSSILPLTLALPSGWSRISVYRT